MVLTHSISHGSTQLDVALGCDTAGESKDCYSAGLSHDHFHSLTSCLAIFEDELWVKTTQTAKQYSKKVYFKMYASICDVCVCACVCVCVCVRVCMCVCVCVVCVCINDYM